MSPSSIVATWPASNTAPLKEDFGKVTRSRFAGTRLVFRMVTLAS